MCEMQFEKGRHDLSGMRTLLGGDSMEIRKAGMEDINLLHTLDAHISEEELAHSVERGFVFLAEQDGCCVGWMRYNLFWDNTPFLNMLFLLEGFRGRGYGSRMMTYWEQQMKAQGRPCVMTSTASDEYAQHFYISLGYRAVGGFFYRNDPYELILMKEL